MRFWFPLSLSEGDLLYSGGMRQFSKKTIQRLIKDKRVREAQKLFVIEGTRLVQDALSSEAPIEQLLVTRNWLRQHGSSLNNFPFTQLDERSMQQLSDTKHPSGVMAVVQQLAVPWPKKIGLVLVLDGLRDPGNVGTLIRSAAAAGADGIWLTEDSVDIYNPKVVRASMGALFRLPVYTTNWNSLVERYERTPFYAADAAGDQSYTQIDWRKRAVLVVGNEPHGLSDQARMAATALIKIPMEHATESVNAAMAGSVIMFEAARQRG